MLLFLFGTSMPVPLRLAVSSASPLIPVPFLQALSLLPSRMGVPILTLPFTLPFSILRCFQPSSSRSIRRVFSFSSLSSRSARRADNWLSLSLAWSSSIVLSSLSTRSRSRFTSSLSCTACLSLRSIWDVRSLTVRSTLRTERCDFDRSFS
ncbi:hypothetical protein F4781DRAFT_352741 [Annulohypoxylon bovei var. microspora]|nr:hypothetical protein F4781DRAFT_352741 [Annulohypoxylon bovei var. microspora]